MLHHHNDRVGNLLGDHDTWPTIPFSTGNQGRGVGLVPRSRFHPGFLLYRYNSTNTIRELLVQFFLFGS